MIKKLFLLIIFALPMVSVVAQTEDSTKPIRFGKVDKKALFNMLPEKAAAELELQEISNAYEAEHKMLQDEFNRKYADFQALYLDGNTPATIKERRMQELQENNQKIESFLNMVKKDLEQREKDLIGPIKVKIQEAIVIVGIEGGFTAIFDANDENIPFLGARVEDITHLVQAKLGIHEKK